MRKKVIIVGAGVGGLALAIRLLYNNYEVHIFEKNSSIGGKVNSLSHNGFKFDLTASILMSLNDYLDIFNLTNKSYKEYIKIHNVNPFYKCFYHDKSNYSFYTDLPRLMNTINKITDSDTNDTSSYLEFISSAYNNYMLSEKNFLNIGFLKTKKTLNFSSIKDSIKAKPISSSYNHVKGYIKNKKLRNFILFQSMYTGISPFMESNTCNISVALSQVNGLYYIEGGLYSYIKALESIFLELGGKISKNTPVDNILFEGTKTIGVSVDGKPHTSDLVVCNCDYSYAINNLIKSQELPIRVSSTENPTTSCSTFILHLGVDKKLPVLKVHNIFINRDFKKNINAPFIGEVSSNPSIYIYCPSSIDPSMAPEGWESLNVTIRVPNLVDSKIKWSINTISYFKEQIYFILEGIPGLENLRKHIIFEAYTTPIDLKNRFNSYGGAAFGLGDKSPSLGHFKPQCKDNNIDNLYFTGSSIHPGNGIHMVLKSSKICANEIIKDNS